MTQQTDIFFVRQAIYDAIEKERDYQDDKWGHNPHTIMEWTAIMHNELSEAMQAWSKSEGEDAEKEALKEILQVVAVGIAAIEQFYSDYGVRERYENRPTKPA